MANRKGMGKGKGSGWKNMKCDDSARHSLASKGIKSAQKIPNNTRLRRDSVTMNHKFSNRIPKRIRDSISKDMASYQDTYFRGGLNYILDDYGKNGFLIGYERLIGSDQQLVKVGGKTIYDSNADGHIKEKKFVEVINKSLNVKFLTAKQLYRVEWAETDQMGTFVEDFASKKEAEQFRKSKLSEDNNIPARTIVKKL